MVDLLAAELDTGADSASHAVAAELESTGSSRRMTLIVEGSRSGT